MVKDYISSDEEKSEKQSLECIVSSKGRSSVESYSLYTVFLEGDDLECEEGDVTGEISC